MLVLSQTACGTKEEKTVSTDGATSMSKAINALGGFPESFSSSGTTLNGKYFERIGDHGTNIAQWVEFSVTGEHKDGQKCKMYVKRLNS